MSRYRDHRPGNPANNRHAKHPSQVEAIWAGYLRGGYFDEHGSLRPEYVSRDRVERLVEAMAKARPQLTMSQLRRFFQHCRRIEAELRQDDAPWGKVLPRVLLLDAAAQDAARKTDPKIPELFFDFIRRNVAAVKRPEDFLGGFLPHFEALVGFGAAHIKKS